MCLFKVLEKDVNAGVVWGRASYVNRQIFIVAKDQVIGMKVQQDLNGKRIIIVGQPMQRRHPSFVSTIIRLSTGFKKSFNYMLAFIETTFLLPNRVVPPKTDIQKRCETYSVCAVDKLIIVGGQVQLYCHVYYQGAYLDITIFSAEV